MGHLGTALLEGLRRAGQVPAADIRICDVDEARLEVFPDADKAALTELAGECGLIFVCVRPVDAPAVLDSLPGTGRVVLSAVAGMSSGSVRKACGAHVLRIMPNLAASLNEAAIAYAEPNDLTEAESAQALAVLGMLGTVVPVSEEHFNVVTGLSGSGPAYAYVLLEGMISGARRLGLPYEAARALAAQTLKGAGCMALATDKSPEELIAAVATPGGTTAAGVLELEETQTAEAAAWAVEAASQRADELSETPGQ